MQVYKFGGASIADPAAMRALLPIIGAAPQPVVLVVSAYGKTTNALEAIMQAACREDREAADTLTAALEEAHLGYARTLLGDSATNVLTELEDALRPIFTELQWAVADASSARFDYSYDQIVSLGELLSTRIFSAFLHSEGYAHAWVDIRDVIRTDDTFRDARVDEAFSKKRSEELLRPILQSGKSIVSQGFIGSTADNATTTLGREGSDYTAALLASMLDAESVTIWKDVEGLLNADPKQFADTVKVEAITYHEVIEMAYYGAQVIHPKTIKPLQNKSIPLYVRSFVNPQAKGTVIQAEVGAMFYPPLIVLKKAQVLLQVTTRDFSFITEENLARIYGIFSGLNVRINLIQNAAISFVACVDNGEEKLRRLIAALEAGYRVFRNEDLSLLTIRHYSPEILFDLTKGRHVLLEQKTRHTVQVVMK